MEYIYTSSHKNWNSDRYRTVAISGNRGRDAGYKGDSYPKLAPKWDFWEKWHNNIGVIPEEENNRFYIKEYYDQVLSKLDPEKVYNDLRYYTVMLCYEEPTEFCHRHIVAAWLELLLEVEVPEAKVDGYSIEVVERPAYIKEWLEEEMRSKNMRGFHSLRARYLFEKGDRYDHEAERLEAKTGKCYDDYRQYAAFLRCDADAAEQEYLERQSAKIKQKK